MYAKLFKVFCALVPVVLVSGPAQAQVSTATAQHCVSFDRHSNSMADFAVNS